MRISKASDIPELAKNMRQSDVEEIWVSHHHTPESALLISFRDSILCFTVESAGRVIAMFGVVPATLIGAEGTIWLLAANDFCKINKIFLRRSKAFIKIMLAHYPHLFNFVDVRNRESIRWLKWCGARFGLVVPYGVEKMPFQYFEFVRNPGPERIP